MISRVKWIAFIFQLSLFVAGANASLITTTNSGFLIVELISSQPITENEFGLGTPIVTSILTNRTVGYYQNGSGYTPTLVSLGYVNLNTGLDFYMRSVYSGNTFWAFSSGLEGVPTPQDEVVFSDIDNSLGNGGSIVSQIGVDEWVLRMDDAASSGIDDDDNELVVRLYISDTDVDGFIENGPAINVGVPRISLLYMFLFLGFYHLNKKYSLSFWGKNE